MRYVPITPPFRPLDHLDFYGQLPPFRNGPIASYGQVVRQYLFAIPESLGSHYLANSELTDFDVLDILRFDPSAWDVAEKVAEIESCLLYTSRCV